MALGLRSRKEVRRPGHSRPRPGPPRILRFRLSARLRYSLRRLRGSPGGCGPGFGSTPCRRLPNYPAGGSTRGLSFERPPFFPYQGKNGASSEVGRPWAHGPGPSIYYKDYLGVHQFRRTASWPSARRNWLLGRGSPRAAASGHALQAAQRVALSDQALQAWSALPLGGLLFNRLTSEDEVCRRRRRRRQTSGSFLC